MSVYAFELNMSKICHMVKDNCHHDKRPFVDCIIHVFLLFQSCKSKW